MKLITNRMGFKEIVINENCNYEGFNCCAENLREFLNIVYTEQINDLESWYWDFDFMQSKLTLHYNIFAGICIFPVATKDASPMDDEILSKIYDLIKNRNICAKD